MNTLNSVSKKSGAKHRDHFAIPHLFFFHNFETSLARATVLPSRSAVAAL